MSVIGITGPSGSGKSVALSVLKHQGFHILDCDIIYNQLLAKDKSLKNAVKTAFPEVFNDDILDRKHLASIVFTNKEHLTTLNSITYPYVESYIKSFIRTSNNKKIVIEAINLINYPIEKMCDRVIVIIASALTRLNRISERDNISLEQAMERLKAQDFEFDMSKYEVIRNDFDTEKEWVDFLKTYFEYV